ncbi:hypothetical protein J5N97_015780 [Dioscorea zingiberensis]|uniref:Uncharacterized protein n=1 Tax=Dioscorea zingiberensis TaxID=325984 RepID=A0A9D5HEV7_9LILI|nr:hypothetical protein J5N97_015780 [Dioscorea zingiberensis]
MGLLAYREGRRGIEDGAVGTNKACVLAIRELLERGGGGGRQHEAVDPLLPLLSVRRPAMVDGRQTRSLAVHPTASTARVAEELRLRRWGLHARWLTVAGVGRMVAGFSILGRHRTRNPFLSGLPIKPASIRAFRAVLCEIIVFLILYAGNLEPLERNRMTIEKMSCTK